jgi:hypothetical protein
MTSPVTHLRLRSTVADAREAIREHRDDTIARYLELDKLLRTAVERAEAGDTDGAHEVAQRACDLEFALTGDCEASGSVADALGAPIEKSPGRIARGDGARPKPGRGSAC